MIFSRNYNLINRRYNLKRNALFSVKGEGNSFFKLGDKNISHLKVEGFCPLPPVQRSIR